MRPSFFAHTGAALPRNVGRQEEVSLSLNEGFCYQRPMKIYTPQELNAMTLDERKVALDGQFGRSFHISANQHVTWIFWARATSEPTKILGHGSAFILDRGGRLMLVTAAHVYRQYLDDQRREGPLHCQVANTMVKDLSAHLIACGNLGIPLDEPDRESDIATFRLTSDEVERIGKRPIVAPATDWPPPPKSGEQVMFCGFPAQERIFTRANEINFGFHSGMTGAASVTHHQHRSFGARIHDRPARHRSASLRLRSGWD
jgi:hypothetical protein